MSVSRDFIKSPTKPQEGNSEWYETEPGQWSTSSDQASRIEMGIKEILWRSRKSGK